jgi:TolB protein
MAQKESALVTRNIWDVVRSDLLLSRYFNLIENGPVFDGSNSKDIAKGWKKLGSTFLVEAQVSQSLDIIQVTLRLIDLNSGAAILGHFYKSPGILWRDTAHQMSDEIVRTLTGKPGIAHTKIAFSNDQTGHKEIYLIDYDGEGLRQLTHDRSIDILPRFTPDGSKIVYTSYKNGNPDLFILDVAPGSIPTPFSTYQGLNIAGGFSPDGRKILMTLSRGQNPNLYVKNISTGRVTRLTNDRGADSSPTFSPDGGQAAFVSDKAGNPEIYILDLLTGRTKRLTRLNWCDSPVWSPTGQWIAFAGRVAPTDHLDILLTDITGTDERNITHSNGSSENPSWSPDGRFIAFSHTGKSGRARLYVMDADGSAPHSLAAIAGASATPSWSP